MITLWPLLILIGCQTIPKKEISVRCIDFFVFIPRLANAEKGDEAVEGVFNEISQHVGSSSQWGRVGFAINHPYTAFVSGENPTEFAMSEQFKLYYERLIRVAHKLKKPILVGLNGGPWATASGPYNAYWKTTQSGRYLSRYQDGQVNQALPKEAQHSADVLKPFATISPYQKDQQQNTLVLTLASNAVELQSSRKKVLQDAVQFWLTMDQKYPDTLVAFTTDSEISSFPFRFFPNGEAIPLGFEDWNQSSFCANASEPNCSTFFQKQPIDYSSSEGKRWFHLRAENHRKFVQDTVNTIRTLFPTRPIYTHQLGLDDDQYIHHRQKFDFGSPQATAIVENSTPGFTAYIYGGKTDFFKKVIEQISSKTKNWALMEFNTGKTWKGSKSELTDFTHEQISYLFYKGVNSIAWLSWKSNSLDTGIKDSGIDEGIKKYLREGPKSSF